MAADDPVLVMGASGFVGSHVTRQLVDAGHRVRVMVRPTSSTVAFDDLDVDVVHGDLFDDEALRRAIDGCATVHYCVVDARMWLRDPARLFRTNVDGLRNVLDATLDVGVGKFVFTSTIGTMARRDDGVPVTEDEPHNWTGGGAYIESRLQAENAVLDYARTKGLPAVAVCPSTTYGPRDHAPTPHGSMIQRVATKGVPVYFEQSLEVVGIEDVARAMLLAAERGGVGERYIISDRMMTSREIHTIAADAAGTKPPHIKISARTLRRAARVNDALAAVLRRDLKMAYVGMKIAELMSPLDHSKAERELGWTPEPAEQAIARAAHWFRDNPTVEEKR